jgi:hypothetical protein
MDTPDTPEPTGFQDLSADSDFTPETPEVAPPGPDSDLETPMFDSAFGGPDSEFGGVDTSAPTQAMETPMFGEANGGAAAGPQVEQPAFDADAFGAAQPEPFASDTAGTPMPDFSPDTAAPTAPTPPPATPQMTPEPVAPVAAKQKGGGIAGMLIAAAVALVIGLPLGLFLGPRVGLIPNPARADLEAAETSIQQKDAQIKDLNAKVTELEGVVNLDRPTLDPEELAKLADQAKTLDAEVSRLTSDKEKLSNDVAQIEADIEDKNQQYVQAQQEYEELLGQTSIVRARQQGLTAEVDRLQGLTGQLEDANARRAATKNTLEHNVERLEVIIREGSPLVPEQYSHAERTAAVASLKARVSQAKWVSPELLDEYTRLYLKELEIGNSREYFYARIPVTDRFGTKSLQWAECLMNGNWSVYYRTLDGRHIGMYADISGDIGPARYEFQDLLPVGVQKQIEQEIVASRPADYEEKIAVLAQKQLGTKEKTKWQESFESLL